jgi:hypothetical protein
MIAEKATATQNDQSTKVMLLGDIRAAFDAAATDRLSTENLVQYLIGQDDRPWPEWTNGMPISKAALSRMLSKFMIHSGSIRLPDGTSPKGFYRRSFEDAFTRYLPPCDATMPHATNQGPSNDLQSATPDAGVADPKWLKIHSGEKSGVVAVCEHGRQADEVSFQEHVPEEGLE